MKKILMIVLSIAALGACRYRTGSGNIITEKRHTGSFTGISVGGGFDVEVKNGPTEVIVESDDNIIKYIETDVENGQLKIRLDHNFSLHDAHLKVYVTSPEITSINSSASANVEVKDVLKSDKSIHLHSSSGSDIRAAVDAPDVFADASSGGEMKLTGRTRNLSVESSSGADINAKGLLSENTVVKASSGAKASVYASQTLDASASSGANVRFRGGASVKQSISSGGEVEKDN